jgi:hypothetical protein
MHATGRVMDLETDKRDKPFFMRKQGLMMLWEISLVMKGKINLVVKSVFTKKNPCFI